LTCLALFIALVTGARTGGVATDDFSSDDARAIVIGRVLSVVDGMQVSARFDAGALIAKPVPLTSGTHEIRVINPSGVSSQTYSLTVE